MTRKRPDLTPRKLTASSLVALCAFALIVPGLLASRVSLPHVFRNGEIADADEVNANFDAIVAAVNGNHDEIQKLNSTVADLERRVRDLERRTSPFDPDIFDRLGDRLPELEDLLGVLIVRDVEFDPVIGPTPTVVFDRVNVQVLNGLGQTDTTNGLGNVILGYNELSASAPVARGGSHNLVLGVENNYRSVSGIVAGIGNEIAGPFSCVVGGSGNLASGTSTTITGGSENFTDGANSVVSGGDSVGEARDNGWSTSGFVSP